MTRNELVAGLDIGTTKTCCVVAEIADDSDILVSGFVLNTMMAAGLAFLGDKIGVDLFLAAVVALGTRVFLNLSLIRRYYLTKAALNRRKEVPAPQ